MVLEIALLGEQRVALAGSLVALRSPRAMALLAYLAIHRGAPQRRDYLAGLFWPDSTNGQARTNLRRELHLLRSCIPDADRWLVADGGTLLWRVDGCCRLDVAVFQAAAEAAESARASADTATFRVAAVEAVRSYRGELMPALYDDWVVVERDRLHNCCLALLDRLVDLEQEAGNYAEAIDKARKRIDLEPLEEVGYRRLLQLQASSGDRGAALRTYQRCVSVLERELGVAPDQATTAEYDRLARYGFTEPAATPTRVQAVPAAGVLPLVGRERELAVLHGRWQEAVDGAAGFALITGEAGVGKSRLLDELAALAQRSGGAAARARCFAAKGRLALAPVSQLLRSPALRAVRTRLDPVWAREVDRLVPARGAGQPASPRAVADAWRRHRFFEGLARAVLSAGRPTLLVLDDLQWCDEDTLAWLQLLFHLGQGYRLLVVASTRSEEVDDNAELTRVLQALRSAGQMTEIDLAPLDASRSADLAAAVLGTVLDRPDAERLHAATGGYPLFVIESARAGSRILGAHDTLEPPDLARLPRARAVLAGRIARASPAAREIAGLAAVIGHGFTLELLGEVSDLDADAVVRAVDELWRRRLLREHSPGSYDFAHGLLRDAIYSQVSTPWRRLLHRRVAQVLGPVGASTHRPGLRIRAAA